MDNMPHERLWDLIAEMSVRHAWADAVEAARKKRKCDGHHRQDPQDDLVLISDTENGSDAT